jgi:hypothetical protein
MDRTSASRGRASPHQVAGVRAQEREGGQAPHCHLLAAPVLLQGTVHPRHHVQLPQGHQVVAVGGEVHNEAQCRLHHCPYPMLGLQHHQHARELCEQGALPRVGEVGGGGGRATHTPHRLVNHGVWDNQGREPPRPQPHFSNRTAMRSHAGAQTHAGARVLQRTLQVSTSASSIRKDRHRNTPSRLVPGATNTLRTFRTMAISRS